jgi:hypothetical protein
MLKQFAGVHDGLMNAVNAGHSIMFNAAQRSAAQRSAAQRSAVQCNACAMTHDCAAMAGAGSRCT